MNFYNGHTTELNNNIYETSHHHHHLNLASPGTASPTGLEHKPNVEALTGGVELALMHQPPAAKRVKLEGPERGEFLR